MPDSVERAGGTHLGEFDIIARYFAPLATDTAALALRDDAAVLVVAEGYELIATCDTLIEGVHFLPDDPPDSIGYKALSVNLSDLAAKAGVAPEEYALQLLEKGDASLVSFNMSEDDIELIMRQPWTMTCTDGDLVEMGVGKPHPRAYGAFARKLKRYVRERNTIDIATAMRTMTSLPATVFGLKDRGQIRAGAFADLLIFDPAKVNDAATYQEPHQLSEGMTHIIVNGVVVRENANFSAALPGRVLSPERR